MSNVRIIAEIGINHEGSEEVARKLIASAAAAGAWGVKFQYRNLANAYANDARQIGDEILQKEIRRNYLSPDQILNLTHYADSLGITPGISFFIPEDVADFGTDIARFGFFKVPSVEFTNLPLIKHIEALGKPSLISTGTYTEATVTRMLKTLDRAIWTPLHCISNYPVNVANAKLGYITHLRELWGGAVGYSSHDEYWETCLLALQQGVSIIERHITFDKAANGLDHSSSSTPDEFMKLARFAENLGLILAGNGPRVPNQGELLNLQNLGRSFYAAGEIAAGDVVTADKVVLRAPRTGLGQEESDLVLGQRALRPVQSGSVIDRSVFEKPVTVSPDAIDFARRKKLSLPVRFHDFEALSTRIPLGSYEFHLTFGDVERSIDINAFDKANRYSVHLPDYVSPTLLMDPFAPDEGQRKASQHVLERTIAFAKALQNRTGRNVPIVGSFSVVHGSLDTFFDQHAELAEIYRDEGLSLLPQWLPPIAWYFGGAARLDAMNNVADVVHIKKRRLPICMDVCHLCMGDKVFDFKAVDVVNELAPYTRHVHIADASGYDGEGMPFGEGDPENHAAIAAAMALDCIKVIEVWQGHLHGGAGFAKAVMALKEQFS